MKLHEFILWPNCKNACIFCHQRKCVNFTEQEKIAAVKKVTDFVTSNNVKQVLLVGGELFDTPFSRELEFSFFNLVDLLWESVDIFYINTNLIYEDTSLVIKFLETVKDFSKLRFTTSYDHWNRFRSDKDRIIMLSNIKRLKEQFPQLRIMVNSILTKELCECINRKEYISPVVENDTCYIPCVQASNISPTRNEILSVLKSNFSVEYLNELLNNMETDQERELYVYKNGHLELCTADNNPCGHNENFSTYASDSNKCFICDLKNLVSLLK